MISYEYRNICIYGEREREKEIEMGRCRQIHIHIYIYIYIQERNHYSNDKNKHHPSRVVILRSTLYKPQQKNKKYI